MLPLWEAPSNQGTSFASPSPHTHSYHSRASRTYFFVAPQPWCPEICCCQRETLGRVTLVISLWTKLDMLPAPFSSEVQSLIQPQFLLVPWVLVIKRHLSIAGYKLESSLTPSPTPTSHLVHSKSDHNSEYLLSSSLVPDPVVSIFIAFNSFSCSQQPCEVYRSLFHVPDERNGARSEIVSLKPQSWSRGQGLAPC